jgi:hypothetical protein
LIAAAAMMIKSKAVPVLLTEHHAMRAYWGSGGIAPHILDGMEVSGQLHAPAALSPGKESLVPIIWEARWGSEKKNSQLLQGLKPPIMQPIAQHYATEIYQLLLLLLLLLLLFL